jgi:hypothetical protein
MKATTIILAAVLTFTANGLFASNDNAVPMVNSTTVSMTSLAPTTPCEADFEDASLTVDVAFLAPTTPTEASMDELNYEVLSALNLAPVTPNVTDFEEDTDFRSLAPVIPAEADFE